MATARGCSASIRPSIRWRCSSAAAIRARSRECARIGADFGYDEINLNVGCPSDRVQEGRFGACLMAEPALVGDCVAAMKAAVRIPVTVKCRIGIDDQDPEEALDALTSAVEAAGVDALIVHARKAWLAGLSPRENRDIPPLDYDRVYRLKAAHPNLPIVLNGGVATLDQAAAHLAGVDGVMMGRAAYQEPWRLLAVDPLLFGEPAPFASPKAAAEALIALHRARARARHAAACHHAPCASACSTACRARARSAGISRRRRSSPARCADVLARRWRW